MYNPHQYYEFDKDWALLECKDSKTANILINTYAPAEIEVNWGDGLIETFPSHRTLFRKHQYTTPFSGKIKLRVKGGRLSMVKDFKIYNQTDNFVVRPETISLFPKVQTVSISGLDLMGTIIGEFADTLPDSVENLTIANTANPESNATFNFALLSRTSRLKQISTYNTRSQSRLKILGDITDIPAGLETIKLTSGVNNLSGDIANISKSVTYFACTGGISLYGNINSLKPGLTSFSINGNSDALAITGDIKNLPSDITVFSIDSVSKSINITGDIAFLPKQIMTFVLDCNNTVHGDISTVGIRDSIHITGKNFISGNLSSAVLVTSLTISGDNIISGDITTLPAKVKTISIYGKNQIYGNIGKIGLRTSCIVFGENYIDGELGPDTKVTSLNIDGKNKISGDLKNLTAGKAIQIGGFNEVYAQLSQVPAFVEYINITGNNTIKGKLSDLVLKNVSTLILGGNSAIIGYSSTSWNNKNISTISLRSPEHQLSQNDVNNFLIDIDNSSVNWVSPKRIYIDGANISPRTAISDNAFHSLKDTKKVTLIVK